jgi:hypothetical protein
MQNVSEDLIAVCKGGKWGFIDLSNRVIIPIIYTESMSFSEGYAQIRMKNKWGYIDKQGKVVIYPDYDFCKPVKDGIACAGHNSLFSRSYSYLRMSDGKVIWDSKNN